MFPMRGIQLALAVSLALAACSGGQDTPTAQKFYGPAVYKGPAMAEVLADLVVLDKSDRRLTLYSKGRKLGDFPVALGFAPGGAKGKSGDGRTPEGLYTIDRRNPASSFYLSIGISYPNAADVARAEAEGVDPGGDIFIHGQPNGSAPGQRLAYDWTNGCIAVSDAEITEIWSRVPTGTPIAIQP